MSGSHQMERGATVNRAHVLATPGMDRGSAYVGMSRRRDNVQLHHSRDDFADQLQLVRALSRERGEDLAGDYSVPAQDQARAFAVWRGIRFPELAGQMVEKVSDKAKATFAGFRSKPTRKSDFAGARRGQPVPSAVEEPLKPSQTRAIEML